eukprot:CAMPEP_0115885274 /NCGR_PEP_ID=MMETSP0287-20121206/30590_1 /TAXON_ID=412157 /ORGANISM="Chrysochromulina rotalis, Strain UIO044" /LENGTH=100 /DNA_ID=CAMNT_0003341687 /DNA_START=700 /DNA_END=1002 /DNA_ORIENTATION=-
MRLAKLWPKIGRGGGMGGGGGDGGAGEGGGGGCCILQVSELKMRSTPETVKEKRGRVGEGIKMYSRISSYRRAPLVPGSNVAPTASCTAICSPCKPTTYT